MKRKYTKKDMAYWDKVSSRELGIKEPSFSREALVLPTVEEFNPKPVKVDMIPFYNRELHKAGDVVRQWVDGKLVTLTLPELDAEGHPLGEESPGKLVVEPNYKRPKFQPAPKKIRGKK